VVAPGISNDSIRTGSLRVRRMEYSTRSFASWSNRSSCIAAYHSTSRAVCNLVARHVANESRCVSAIKTIAKGQRRSFRFQAQTGRLLDDATNDLLVFFRLKTACAVNKHAVRF